MYVKPKYRTRQRETLLRFLEQSPGIHFTVADVCAYFSGQGSPIGQTTVYRQLERMVDEGIVDKYIIDGKSPACFAYNGETARREQEVCFHCKCERCGRLIHLHCEELEGIASHLYQSHDFRLNPLRTVFYGLCGDCAADAGKEENHAASDGQKSVAGI